MRVLLAVAAVLLLAAPAQALPILDEADATDLQEQLAEAGEATGVCFGWLVDVVALDGSAGGQETGGEPGGCTRSLQLAGSITYTSEASESEDSASLVVQGTGFEGATIAGLEALAGREAGELLGDQDDKALYELVAALPLYAAQLDPSLAGRLPAVETGGAPADARVDDAGGNDFLRTHGLKLVLALGLGLAGAFLILTRPRSA